MCLLAATIVTIILPMTEPSEPPEEVDWRETLRNAVDLASENPDAFAQEVKMIAKKFGVTVEQVYRKLQDEPAVVKTKTVRTIRNSIIQNFAKKLKRDLGL